MKKQLLIILSVFFFAINPVCFAKTITIDSVNYNVEANNILKKDNFTYDPNQDLLTLYNDNLKTIHTTENLNIVLEGENTFINDNIGTTIKAKNLEIKGKGNLKITSLGKGLEIAKFTLTNTNLSIDSQDVGIVASSYDVIINNSTLEINSCEDAFRIIEKNLYLNNSKLKINSKFLIGDFGKDIYVNNSNLNLKLQYGIRSSLIYLLYVNGNSNLFLETINSNNKFLVNNLVLDNNLKLLGSLDNKNYEEKFDYEKTKYIQIITLN